MADERELLRWSEALAGIARTGLGFTENLYERERFEEVLHIAADIRARAQEGPAPTFQVEEWLKSVGEGVPGYVTPKIAIGAVVGNDQGEILLVKRADSGLWLFPTGWADVGYSAAEVAEKEVHEETGIEAEVVRLISVVDGIRQGFTRVPLYSIVFHCRAVGGELAAHPLETDGVGSSRRARCLSRWRAPRSGPTVPSQLFAESRLKSTSTSRADPRGGPRTVPSDVHVRICA